MFASRYAIDTLHYLYFRLYEGCQIRGGPCPLERVRLNFTAKIVLLSLVLGFATCELIGAINYLPHSTASQIKDALSYPGALIAWPFYPEGVHTGSGAAYWGGRCRAADLERSFFDTMPSKPLW